MGAPMAPRPANPTRNIGADFIRRSPFSGAYAPQRKTPAEAPASVIAKIKELGQPWGPQMDSTALAASMRRCASSASVK